MVKIIIFSILTTVFFAVLSNSPTLAAGVGEACCPNNYSYLNGRCMSDRVNSGCESFTNGFCRLNEIISPSANITHDACINLGNTTCKNYLTNNGTYSGRLFCQGLVGQLPLGPIIGPTVVTACIPIAENVFNRFQNQSLSQSIQCDPGLACSSAGGICMDPRDAQFAFDVCKNVPNSGDQSSCANCFALGRIWTALGCISFNGSGFIKNILQIAIGIGGGIALLLMIFGAFRVSTSAGDPKAAQAGREIIGGAVAGLLIIIFSVVILNLIGVELLKIPGL